MVENELDKTRVKCGEAEHMHKTYLQIRGALENEHKDLHLVLDQADNEITRLLWEYYNEINKFRWD